MQLIATRLRALRFEERGFTLVTVMGVVLIVLILSAAAFSATSGDARPSTSDRQRKEAYAAAEAGVADYLARLVANSDYWRRCTTNPTTGADPDPDNPSLNQVSPATRRWATIPGSAAQYSIELLPANGASACSASDPVGTFIDTTTGTFRIRATGRAAPGAGRRSIIATFRRRGFLDYIYFTDLETGDPMYQRVSAGGRTTKEDPPGGGTPVTQRDVVRWATDSCGYFRDGRGSALFRGQSVNKAGRLTGSDPNLASSWSDWTVRCSEIRFVGDGTTNDTVDGPLHTNDELLLCGTPKFGRYPADSIEVSASAPGWRQDSGSSCTGQPDVNLPGGPVLGNRGTFVVDSPLLTLPPSNGSLYNDALPAYRFIGKTTIVLNDTMMTVTGKRESGTVLSGAVMPIPTDGVVHVGDDPSGTCPRYDPLTPSAAPATCGDLWVRGTYSRNVTLTASNDIVLDGNLTRVGTANPLLGLISTNWIRVHHPVDSSCNNVLPNGDRTIHAAILSLNHSFAVDNYWCGAKIGTLHVVGAIGQKYRGPVGSGGATTGSGYLKNYTYNDDLRFRAPPKFLDPVQSAWRLVSQVEQVPAAGSTT